MRGLTHRDQSGKSATRWSVRHCACTFDTGDTMAYMIGVADPHALASLKLEAHLLVSV